MTSEQLARRIVAVLPRRMPGRMVTAIAAELAEPVPAIQAALLAMEGREVLRRGRYGHQHWYLGPASVMSAAEPDVQGLW